MAGGGQKDRDKGGWTTRSTAGRRRRFRLLLSRSSGKRSDITDQASPAAYVKSVPAVAVANRNRRSGLKVDHVDRRLVPGSTGPGRHHRVSGPVAGELPLGDGHRTRGQVDRPKKDSIQREQKSEGGAFHRATIKQGERNRNREESPSIRETPTSIEVAALGAHERSNANKGDQKHGHHQRKPLASLRGGANRLGQCRPTHEGGRHHAGERERLSGGRSKPRKRRTAF